MEAGSIFWRVASVLTRYLAARSEASLLSRLRDFAATANATRQTCLYRGCPYLITLLFLRHVAFLYTHFYNHSTHVCQPTEICGEPPKCGFEFFFQRVQPFLLVCSAYIYVHKTNSRLHSVHRIAYTFSRITYTF